MKDIFVAADANQKKEEEKLGVKKEVVAKPMDVAPVAVPKKPSKKKFKKVKKTKKTKNTKKKDLESVPYKERKSKKKNPLMAFSYMPRNVKFETKESQEKVVLLLRKHPITNIGWIVIAFIMVLAPATLGIFPIIEFLPSNFKLITISGWYLITSAFVIENFLGWFFNVNIVTDERILDFDFHNLVHKEVSEAKTEDIQDVTYTVGGTLGTVINYGNVLIQTAAEEQKFEFLKIPKPDKVAKILRELRIEEEVEKLEGRIR